MGYGSTVRAIGVALAQTPQYRESRGGVVGGPVGTEGAGPRSAFRGCTKLPIRLPWTVLAPYARRPV